MSGRLWKASPGTRMMELLHAADVPVGLVTNGEEWMLVSARRGETTGFASWYADLWMQEPLTLRAFHSLLHLRRLVGVANPDTLSGLLLESSKDQQEVTDQLGYQVREAVEVLVQAFDHIDAESGRILLATIDEKTLLRRCTHGDDAPRIPLLGRRARVALARRPTVRPKLRLFSTLSELLRERADQHGEEVLERRHDAWVSACWPRSGLSMPAWSTKPCGCLHTVAASLIPIAIRSLRDGPSTAHGRARSRNLW